jgi:hypothetical protein
MIKALAEKCTEFHIYKLKEERSYSVKKIGSTASSQKKLHWYRPREALLSCNFSFVGILLRITHLAQRNLSLKRTLLCLQGFSG